MPIPGTSPPLGLRSRSRSPGNEFLLKGRASRSGRGGAIATALAGIAHTLERRSLNIKLEVFGARNPDPITSMAKMSLTWWQQGRYKEPEVLDFQVAVGSKERGAGREARCYADGDGEFGSYVDGPGTI